jgi:hypothetical protein
MFAHEYKALFVEDHEAEKHQPCPSELAKTKVIQVDGFKCKVFFNYVAPYTYGSLPLNTWRAYAEFEINGDVYCWMEPLDASVKTLKEACKIIKPLFAIATKRLKTKLARKEN